MTLKIDIATPGNVVGRMVGKPGTPEGQYVAVAVAGSRLLAVHVNGAEYVVALFGPNMAEDGINMWGEHYFAATVYGGAWNAFDAAVAELNRKPAIA